jgi:hypothetical protein
VVVEPMWAKSMGISTSAHGTMNEVSCLYDKTILT